MSSVKRSKSEKGTKQDDKKIIVSFTSDSEDDDKSTSSSSESSGSDGDSRVKQEVATHASVAPVRPPATNEKTPSCDDLETVRVADPPSPVASRATDQQPNQQSVSVSSNQEKPAKKTAKSKSKETSKSTTDGSINGIVSDKLIESDGKEPTVAEPKTKKKNSPKSEASAVNGSQQLINPTTDDHTQQNENENNVKKTKTTKKTAKNSDTSDTRDDSIKSTPKKITLVATDETPVINLDDVKSKENAQSSTAMDENNPKPAKKSTKKSTKSSPASASVNGEVDKVAAVDEGGYKTSEKNSSKKSKEAGNPNSDVIETTNKIDSSDSISEKVMVKSTIKDVSQQASSATVEQTDDKVKLKKKKEKVSEIANDNGDAEDAATVSKVVKKKKTKKVEQTDSSDCTSALTPSIVIQDVDAIDRSDLDADREVQSICSLQTLESASNGGESSQNMNKTMEVTVPVADIIKTSVDEGLGLANLQFSSGGKSAEKSSTDTKSKVGDIGCVEEQGGTPHANNDSSTGPKVDDKEHLEVIEDQVSNTDIAKKPRDNEESDFTYRRKSMDDFIKRILAEARDEQQKRMGTNPPSSDESASFSIADKSTIDHDADNDSSSYATDKDQSMLDRRLASTDRRRIDTSSSPRTVEEYDKSKKPGLTTDLDLDDDLAQIKGYFSRRNQSTASKLDPSNDISDDLISAETGYRSKVSRLDVGNSDDLLFTQKLSNETVPENGSSYLSRLRQQQEMDAGESFGDTFSPRRREETSDVVRSSIRPVRAVIDQQTDIIQQLKTTSRSIDELENEIQSLRERFHDRQARIESLRSAIDAERRIYDAEQTAANDRVQQQKLPGGHFVRDEFMASIVPRVVSTGDYSFRARSGSVSGSSGLGLGSFSISGGVGDSSVHPTRASSVKPSSVSGDPQRRQFADDDDGSTMAGSYTTGRLRRGGSVARERTYTTEELLGGTSSSWNSRASTDLSAPTSYSTTSPWMTSYTSSTTAPETNRYGLSQSPLSYGRYQYDPNDYKSPSSYSSNSYSSDSSRTNPRVGLGIDRSYVHDSTSPSASARYLSSSTGTSYVDPSRFRRAQSVLDVSSDNSYSTYDNSNSYISSPRTYTSGSADGSSEFQSRFLDKVRGKKGGGDDSQSGSSQFKSRFLRSTFDTTTKKY